jgi:hypothetical protein
VRCVKALSRRQIRARAIVEYGLEAAGTRYEAYFDRVASLWGDGWYDGFAK